MHFEVAHKNYIYRQVKIKTKRDKSEKVKKNLEEINACVST